MKKKLLACLGVFGLALTSLFISPIMSNASEVELDSTKLGIETQSNVSPYTLKDKSGNIVTKVTNEHLVSIPYSCYGEIYDSARADKDTIIEYLTECKELLDGGVILIDDNSHCFPLWEYTCLGVGFNCEVENNLNLFESENYSSEFCGLVAYPVLNASKFIEETINLNLWEDLMQGDHVDFIFTNLKYDLIDVVAPEIGGTINVSVNVDFQPSIEEILSHVYAKDETDGYVPVELDETDYVQGEMIVGNYFINIEAYDKALNRAHETIRLHRYDSTSPSISGTDNYDLNYDNDLTLEKIESALTITDNVDSGLTLEKVSDTFSGNEHKVGNYQVVYRTQDKSGNYSSNKTINVSVKNKGFSVISGSSEIRVGTNEVLSLEDFKSNVSVIDGYDGVVTNYQITGFDDYTKTAKVTGTNIVRVSYINSGGNESHYDFKIVKEDRISPDFYFDNYFILLKQGEVFTRDMIIANVAQVLSISVDEIIDIKGTYDTNKIGDYNLTVCLANGENKAFKLSVVDSYSNSDDSDDKSFSINDYVNNFSHFNNWNIYHWLTVGVIGIIIVLIIVLVVKKRNKKKNKKQYYD